MKALDNLDEICPRVVICNAHDYPRHWKLIVKQLRECWNREQTVIILATGYDFDLNEANKATFLGVNALYCEDLENEEKYHLLKIKIQRYISTNTAESISYLTQGNESVNFIFQHPCDQRMISGHFTTISPIGGNFSPSEPEDSHGIEAGDLIEAGSMRVAGELLAINARVVSNNGTLSMEFVNFDSQKRNTLASIDEVAAHMV